MKRSIRLLGLPAALAVAALAVSVSAAAVSASDQGGGTALFVQDNSTDGNGIVAYQRNGDGSLTFLTTYPTGGLGGRQAGAGSDPLASQGSLVRDGGLLLAVNAGSDSITVFRIAGDTLVRTQVVSSGGPFPTSLAAHGNLVYVLDAGGQGFVSGYRVTGDGLQPIAGSTRTLLLGNTTTPFFLSSPAEVGFTPDGEHLIVTTKTHGTVDVFSIGPDGTPSAAPVKNAEAGVPFAFIFNSAGQMVLNFAGTGSLEAFTVNADDTITPAGAPVSDGQAAACWVTPARDFAYVSNTGSNDVSQFRTTSDGAVTLVNPTAASNIPGAIDSDSAGGAFLYVQAGLSSSVHVFRIGPAGSLTLVQVAAVPDGDDQEGIVVA